MEQLRVLAKAYARQVPFGLDWPINFWASEIGFHTGDHAARCWLDGYFQRHQTNKETRH